MNNSKNDRGILDAQGWTSEETLISSVFVAGSLLQDDLLSFPFFQEANAKTQEEPGPE